MLSYAQFTSFAPHQGTERSPSRSGARTGRIAPPPGPSTPPAVGWRWGCRRDERRRYTSCSRSSSPSHRCSLRCRTSRRSWSRPLGSPSAPRLPPPGTSPRRSSCRLRSRPPERSGYGLGASLGDKRRGTRLCSRSSSPSHRSSCVAGPAGEARAGRWGRRQGHRCPRWVGPRAARRAGSGPGRLNGQGIVRAGLGDKRRGTRLVRGHRHRAIGAVCVAGPAGEARAGRWGRRQGHGCPRGVGPRTTRRAGSGPGRLNGQGQRLG